MFLIETAATVNYLESRICPESINISDKEVNSIYIRSLFLLTTTENSTTALAKNGTG
ncbi:MAG: hypothetical protein IPP79_18515 [Chitinophagaceae bacterium]|nr:hypothetical protein [Chitinophagaceae bacterium]